MAEASATRLLAFATVFTVADVARSLVHFVERLGFREEFRLGDPAEYAIVDRDAVSIHLMPASRAPEARGQSGVYVFAADVDALHAELLGRGSPIELAPRDLSYGMREMSVRDPDGNRITFGQPLAGTAS